MNTFISQQKKDMNVFDRTEKLLGADTIEKLNQAKIAVFGLGAVGGFAIEGLARAGIGSLSLIDFDYIEASNINRQILALHSTLGASKTTLAKQRILDINPDCNVQTHCSFVNSESLSQFLSRDIDIVIDAIDGLNSKVNLIYETKQMGINIISSMGAAGRIDLSKIHVSDIKDSSVCPLARVVRRRLHRRGIFEGVECVFSTETPVTATQDNIKKNLEYSEDIGQTEQDHGRTRTPLGSIVWVPAVFGMTLAARAVDRIIKKQP